MNLIQQKQIQGLSATLDSLSGQIGETGDFIWQLMSGDSVFSGEKTFTGEAIFNTGVEIFGPLVVYNRGTFSEVGINLPLETGVGFTGFFPQEGFHVRERNILVSSGDLHVSGDGSDGGHIYVSGTDGEKTQLIPHWNWRGAAAPYGLYYSGAGVGALPGDGNIFIGFTGTTHADTFTERVLNVSGDANFIGDFYNSGSLTLQGETASLIVGVPDSGMSYDHTTQSLGVGTLTPTATIESTGDIKGTTGYLSGLYIGGEKAQTQGVVTISDNYTGNSYFPIILVDSPAQAISIDLGYPSSALLSSYTGLCSNYQIIDIAGASATYPITVSGGGALIDDELSITIDRDFGSMKFFTDGYSWYSTSKDETFTFSSPPLTRTAAGKSGQMAIGTSDEANSAYLYVCTGTNLWGRTQITGWS